MANQRRQMPRRKTEWFGTLNAAGANQTPLPIGTGSGVTTVLAQGLAQQAGSGASDQEVTITRTIGNIYAALDGTGAAATGGGFAIGCLVVRAEALAAGVASMPNPESDPDVEWLYYTNGMLAREAADTIPDSGLFRLHFDVRGQRIIRSGSTIVWLGSARAVALNLGVSCRYLVKLP